MSMQYIRRYYKVPAKRGQKVIANGQLGVITGSRGAYLRIRLEKEKKSSLYHPIWEMQYCS
ncbi:hypothetical protein Lqui_2124 [Legionella quinlivanii]|uniref:Uncharacterized protein n=2 Tax=Legionella TaxID=445 RepID=A0A0W0XUI4_9GAMM|nr:MULTISPECIES: hypothetical protein [Legionella]KTC71467.1 hypothetical protein Lbir_1721 [Legionella birminghamensis]KTD48082.1 hypothetical protein Lqui_2124 [Legionella quinlivanii]SEG48622.1 hypothetical protein SAMN02746093_03121 [Legionella quinlivanii DSM 21216]STX60866.1 Uncharacterised protein [Legionella birminghamensis]STY49784.1 Uncharacterised protein [Legionella quinlivanii]